MTIDQPADGPIRHIARPISSSSARRAWTFGSPNPAGDRIVADGKWVWVYLPSATPDQVIRMPVGDGHSTPAGGAVSLDFISQFLTDPPHASR